MCQDCLDLENIILEKIKNSKTKQRKLKIQESSVIVKNKTSFSKTIKTNDRDQKSKVEHLNNILDNIRSKVRSRRSFFFKDLIYSNSSRCY